MILLVILEVDSVPHKYTYVHGDPVNLTDPTGMFASVGISLGGFISTTVRLAGVSAAVTALGSAAVIGASSYNVGRDVDHLPDGLVVTLSGGGAVRGFQGGLGVGIYAELASGKIYWFHTRTFGTAPLSAFKSNSPSGSISFDFGVSWNTTSEQDLAGYSTTTALPIFLLHRLSKFRRGVTSITDWETFMLTLAQYSNGSNIVNRRNGALSVTQSIGNGAAVTSFAFRSYNFALTATHSSPLRELLDVNVLGQAAGEFVGRLKDHLALVGGQDLTPEKLGAIINDLDDLV